MDDEQRKAHKYVLMFAHNLELGDVTIFADDGKIKAHKYLLSFAVTFFSIHF